MPAREIVEIRRLTAKLTWIFDFFLFLGLFGNDCFYLFCLWWFLFFFLFRNVFFFLVVPLTTVRNLLDGVRNMFLLP